MGCGVMNDRKQEMMLAIAGTVPLFFSGVKNNHV